MAIDNSPRTPVRATARQFTSYAREIARALVAPRRQRSAASRRIVFDLLSRFTPSVAVDRDGIRYYVSTTDKIIGRYTFGGGEFEEELIERAIIVAERELGRGSLVAGHIVMDVGANIGTTTIPLLMKFGARKAIAFEPDEENFILLRCNAIANRVADRVDLVQSALSSYEGVATLERSGNNSGDHRIRTAPVAADDELGERARPTHTVPVTTLDGYVRQHGLAVDDVGLVWMDTQGHEGHVLAGGTTLVESAVPVVAEYWPYGLRRSGGLELFHEIVAHNYNRVIDLRRSTVDRPVPVEPKDIAALESSYGGVHSYTDLLLLRG